MAERDNLRQKLERARKEIDVAILIGKAVNHALINLVATVDDLTDELDREEANETVSINQ